LFLKQITEVQELFGKPKIIIAKIRHGAKSITNDILNNKLDILGEPGDRLEDQGRDGWTKTRRN